MKNGLCNILFEIFGDYYYIKLLFIFIVFYGFYKTFKQMKGMSNKIDDLISHIKDEKILNTIDVDKKLIFVNKYIYKIEKEITDFDINKLRNNIKIQVRKFVNVFTFLNNIKLLLFSRKYVNSIIKNQVDSNKNLYFSKKKYLIDLVAYSKMKNNKKAIKSYITNFIFQKTKDNNIITNSENDNYILPDDDYNLTLDFLYFLKNNFNNNIHIVNPIKDINYNISFYNIFNQSETNDISEKEENVLNIIEKISYDVANKNLNNNILNNNELLNGKNEYNLIGKKSNPYIKSGKDEIIDKSIKNKFTDLVLHKNAEYIFPINNYSLNNLKKEIDELITLIKGIQIDNFEIKSNTEYTENNINFNELLIFSIKKIRQESILNLKKEFIKYFEESLDKSISIKYNDYFQNTKINEKFVNIENIINNIEKIYTNIFNKEKLKNYENDEFLSFRIKDIRDSITSISELKDEINLLKEKLKEFFQKKIILYIMQNENDKLDKNILTEKDALSFETLLNEWKQQFNEDYIKKIKKACGINENKINFEFDKTDVEFLYSSKEHALYFKKDLAMNIHAKEMIDNIEKLGNNYTFTLIGPDEDIDYSKIKRYE